MSTIYATLPREVTLDGIVHLLHWKTRNHAVYQSYTLTAPSSSDPIASPLPQIAGESKFSVYQVIQHNPGESLGGKLASYTDLHSAISYVEKQEQLA